MANLFDDEPSSKASAGSPPQNIGKKRNLFDDPTNSGDGAGSATTGANWLSGARSHASAPPRVDANEIALFLLQSIVPKIRQVYEHRSVGNLLLIECPFDFAEPISNVLGNEKLLSYFEIQQPMEMPDGKVGVKTVSLPAFQSLTQAGRSESALEAMSKEIHTCLASKMNFVVMSRSAKHLPASLRSLARSKFTIPRFDERSFLDACNTFYDNLAVPLELRKGDGQWVRHVTPLDFMINTAVKDEEIISSIQDSVRQRLENLSEIRSGVPLAKRNGTDHVRAWAGDIKEALDAHDPSKWETIGRGALLEGSDLVEKAEIARAIADECGLSFVSTSTHDWTTGVSDPVVDFQRAQDNAPALLFIDGMDLLEIDASGRSEYDTLTSKRLLAPIVRELSKFDLFAPVIVLGAVASGRSVNYALRQPGRLERVFAFPDPTPADLAAKFQYILDSQNVAHEIADEEFDRLGRYAWINDPRLIDLYVAHARRRALPEGGKLAYRHLRDAMILGVREGKAGIEKDAESFQRTAFHEAGHAALKLLRGKGKLNVEYLTIKPGPGYLGFMHPALEDSVYRSNTYQDFVDAVWVSLGGRVAEDLRYGATNVSTGAGGGQGSDLSHATTTAVRMFCLYGMSPRPSSGCGENLTLAPIPSIADALAIPGMRDQVEQFLRSAYADAYQELKKHWRLVQDLAGELVREEVLDAVRIRAIFAEYQASSESPSAG